MRQPLRFTVIFVCACQGLKSDLSSPTEIQDVDVPISASSGGGVLKVKFTSGSINDSANLARLEHFFSNVFSPSQLLTRGGFEYDEFGNVVPLSYDTGVENIAAMVQGSTPEQERAWVMNAIITEGGDASTFFDKSDAIDTCSNNMIADYLSPAMFQDVYTTISMEDIVSSADWPDGVCGDDPNCDTTAESTWNLSIEGESDDMYAIQLRTSGINAIGEESAGFSGHFNIGFLVDDRPLAEESWGHRVYPVYVAMDSLTIDVAHGAQQANETEEGSTWYFLGQGERTSPEVSISTTPITNCQSYFDWQFAGARNVPFGCNETLNHSVTIDTNSLTGYTLWADLFGESTEPTISSDELMSELSQVLEYHMAAAVACLRYEALNNNANKFSSDAMSIEYCEDPELTECTLL